MSGKGILHDTLEHAAAEGWERLALIDPRGWSQHRQALINAGWPEQAVVILDRSLDADGFTREALPGLRRNAALRHLDLAWHDIGAKGARALAKLTGLTSLDLGHSQIGDEGARALAKLTGLTSLNLDSNEIGAEGTRALAKLTGLTSLDLGNNQIGDEGARALTTLTGLTSLNLWGNKIGDEGVRALAKLTGLTSLNLYGNQIGAEGARALATLTGLTSLDLGNNQIDDEGTRALAKLTGLTSLYLSGNQIGAEGARALAKLTGLTSLDLWGNRIGAKGARALPALTELTSLNLWGNQIGDEGARALSTLTGLTSLNLKYNDLHKFPEAMDRLPRLRTLQLDGNSNLGIPEPLLESTTSPQELRRLYDQARRGGRIMEAKAVVLGEPASGKSWLRHRLAGKTPPNGREITHSYECERLTVKAESPVAGEGEQQIGVTLFDFGGQPVLHGTHRFFMASLRNVFIVCVHAGWTWERNRLEYWLRLIRHEHERQVRARRREVDSLASRGLLDPEGRRFRLVATPPEDTGGDESQRAETPLAEPAPPVVVVVTHSTGKKPDWFDRLEPDRLQEILGGRVRVVGGYDSGARPEATPTNLDQVVGAIGESLTTLDEVWSARVDARFNTVKQRLVEWRGPSEDGLVGSWMSLTRRYADLFDRGWFDEASPEALHEADRGHWLLLYRDIGLVHWVGDWPGVRAGDRLRSYIFNPEWVRLPVYNVLWDRAIGGNDGLIEDEHFCGVLRARPQATHGPLTTFTLSEEDEAALKDLMEITGLCVRVPETEDAPASLLIPDHLSQAPPELPQGWEEAGHIETGSYAFLPDYALLPVIAERYAQRVKGSRVYRDRIEIQGGGTAASARAMLRLVTDRGGARVEVRVLGGAEAGRDLAAALKSDVVRTLHLAPRKGWSIVETKTSGARVTVKLGFSWEEHVGILDGRRSAPPSAEELAAPEVLREAELLAWLGQATGNESTITESSIASHRRKHFDGGYDIWHRMGLVVAGGAASGVTLLRLLRERCGSWSTGGRSIEITVGESTIRVTNPEDLERAIEAALRLQKSGAGEEPAPGSDFGVYVPIAAFRQPVHLGIITMKEEEHAAVRANLEPSVLLKGRRTYDVGPVSIARQGGPERHYNAAIVRCPEQGNGIAQQVANDMIQDLRPEWILLVGIAGAVPSTDFGLGDVVCATRVNDFCVSAARDDGAAFAIAGGPMHREVENLLGALPSLLERAADWNTDTMVGMKKPGLKVPALESDRIYGDDGWRKDVHSALRAHFPAGKVPRPPLATSRPIASSDALLKSGKIVTQWQQTARNLAAIEMELAGVYRAARTAEREFPVLAVRGISDIVGFKRDEEWTRYACHTAASLAAALARLGAFGPGQASPRRSVSAGVDGRPF